MAVATGEGARHPGDVERIKRLEQDVDMLMMDRDKLMREKVAWYIERAHLGQVSHKLMREKVAWYIERAHLGQVSHLMTVSDTQNQSSRVIRL